MRCPVCDKTLSDEPLALESHRKRQKGACGEHPIITRHLPRADEATRYTLGKSDKGAAERRWSQGWYKR